MKSLLSLGLFLSITLAQNPAWLEGDWQAQFNGETLSFLFGQDTSYTFDFSSEQEPDQGLWSLSGNALTLESTIYENTTYTLEQLSETSFRLSGGDLNSMLDFSRIQNMQNPLTTQAENPLTKPASSNIPQNWFLGEWIAVNGLQTITLINNADGTYTFDINDLLNPYHEEGTWTLEDNQFTQKWKDPATGQDTEAIYTIEKLSEDSFHQSGGNLGDMVFSFTRAGGDPLADLGDILTQPADSQNPLADTASQPGTSQTANTSTQVTALPPPVDPTITPAFLIGEWIARTRSNIYSFTVRESTYTWQISKWNGEVIYQEDAQWTLENGLLKQVWQNQQTGLTETSYYEPEKVSENTVRMRGGNFGLQTFLFHRVLPKPLSPVSSWLVGYWTSIVGIDSWGFVFQPDGSYTLTVADFQNQGQTFQGNWRLEHDKLFLTGDKNVTYTLGYIDDLVTYLSGEDLGDSITLFQKINQDPRDPYQIPTFVGQYIQQNHTLVVTHDGTSYRAQMLFKDALQTYHAQATGDSLQLMDDTGQLAYTLRLDNNGLKNDGDFSLTPYWQKISERTLHTPNQRMGYWLQTERLSQDNDLLLLPDGRYRQSQYFDIGGQISGSVTEGLYRLEGDQLTLDPQCAGPSTYTIKQVQNHLLFGGSGGFEGDNKLSVTTYMAVPATSIDYQLSQTKLRDEIEVRINAEWEQKIPLGSVNTTLGRIPPTAEISVDEFYSDVFPDATVFAEQELYPYQSDYFYFYDKNGAFRSGTQGMMIIDPGFSDQIDFARGEYHDKQNTYFFPNGRTMTYIETYLDATKITYPPTPNVKFFWNKYRIEDNKIIVGEGDSATAYELLNGRRHMRSGEQCFENIEFSVSGIKQ